MTERAIGDGPRTPGGWTPVGTAASRRAAHLSAGTARGRASRRKVVDAARSVFERDGFFDARVEDIVATAGVSRGTFYTYFSTKVDVLEVLADEINDALTEVTDIDRDAIASYEPDFAVSRYVARVLETCRDDARMMEVIAQAAVSERAVARSRGLARAAHVSALAAVIRAWQITGRVPGSIAVDITAEALIAMMQSFALGWAADPTERDLDEVVAALSDLCLRALGIPVER